MQTYNESGPGMNQRSNLIGWKPLLLCVLLLLLIGRPSYAAQSDEDPLVLIETYLNNAVETNAFSGSVLIARDGEILLSEGYGLANREWDIPNAPDTKFRIASLTKQFTAMAILMLQEHGSLNVEDHICQYVEDCPAAWEDITLQHLLTHTSGIPNYTDVPGFAQTVMALPISPQHLIERFINEPLDFQPGEGWNYSNSGYILLGHVIEEASGDSYQTFLPENLFEPLGMTNTGYDRNSSIIAHRAEGYLNAAQKADPLDMSNEYAAGGLYSTVEDLYVWEQALFGGEVVSQETWGAMLAAAVPLPNSPEGSNYGYGLFIDTAADHASILHFGQTNGFTSWMTHLTDDNVTIIILSNFEQAAPWNIGDIIIRYMFDEI